MEETLLLSYLSTKGINMLMRICDMPNIYKHLYKLKLEREHMNQQNQLLKAMNATIVTGEYTDRNTGQTKKSYLTIGKLFVYNDGGMSLKLDALPSNGQPINFYDIKPKNQNNNNQNNQQQQGQNQNRYN